MQILGQASGFRLQASGFRLQASGFRLQASGFRLQASGFRDWLILHASECESPNNHAQASPGVKTAADNINNVYHIRVKCV